MNSKSFLIRNIFLWLIIWVIIFALYACSPAFPSTEPQPTFSPEPTFAPATEPPASTEEPGSTAVPTQGIAGQDSGAVLETRRLTLEFPPKIKADSASDIVRLTLEVDDLGNITPTAFYQENIVTGEVIQIPNLYETHKVGVEARFDIAGVQVEPSGNTYQPMIQGEPVTFYWSIRAAQVGKFRGTIWVNLVFVDRVSGEETRKPVSAQIVDIEAVDFFGFSTNVVKTSGVIGSVLGLVVGFPFFDDIVKYLFSRRKKKKKPSDN